MNKSRNLSASVRQRLKNVSTAQREDFQAILTRYALERFLYRLSQSSYCERFVLKGALLFSVWSQQPHRATRDIDLLGFGDNSLEGLKLVFQDICDIEVLPDGLEFHALSVDCQRIKPDQEYEGVRINLLGNLIQTRTRISLQIDVGFGDAVTPAPIALQFPTILNFPTPIISTYPRETVIAEKFQAIVMLGMANSRMKDFYDLWFLATNFEYEGKILVSALQTTFARRKTSIPASVPLALTTEFTEDRRKLTQWQAFLKKAKLDTQGQSFDKIVDLIGSFLMPLCFAVAEDEDFEQHWKSNFFWQ